MRRVFSFFAFLSLFLPCVTKAEPCETRLTPDYLLSLRHTSSTSGVDGPEQQEARRLLHYLYFQQYDAEFVVENLRKSLERAGRIGLRGIIFSGGTIRGEEPYRNVSGVVHDRSMVWASFDRGIYPVRDAVLDLLGEGFTVEIVSEPHYEMRHTSEGVAVRGKRLFTSHSLKIYW